MRKFKKALYESISTQIGLTIGSAICYLLLDIDLFRIIVNQILITIGLIYGIYIIVNKNYINGKTME